MPMYDYPATTTTNTSFVHPEVSYWHDSWVTIRDAALGEIEIKRKGTRYLPKLPGMSHEEYAEYASRAVFFNMTARTITGLMGTLFRRNPVITGLPDKFNTANISKQNQSLMQFVKEAGREILTTGRYGVLVDMDEDGKRPPYLAGYIAENIVDWTIEEVDGRWTVTEVILRELRLARPVLNPISLAPAGRKMPKMKNPEAETFSMDSAVTRAARRWITSYRVLRLEEDPANPGQRLYRQYYHVSSKGDASPEGTPFAVYTPTWRGQPFRYIPFMFFGPSDNTPDIDKSPILDIVTINMSHYKSYAQLEHGRFYTALPVYYCPISPGQERGTYTIGPSVVWEVESGSKPGIVEFNGQGLMTLLQACDKKEDQIAALGGRLVGVERVSAGESNNMLKTKEANEQSLLLNVSNVIDVGFTAILRWWAMWQDVSPVDAAKITLETNKDFLATSSGAREFRAIQMMYENGIIPIDVVYDYLRRSEVIPDWMALDEFKQLLDSPNSFPNATDVLAKQRGAPNASTEWQYEHVLASPDVVAVRGFDSQAPEGQMPLPGQTQGGAVTAEMTMPGGLGAEPVAPSAGGAVKAGTTTTTQPKARTAPKSTSKPVTQNPRATVKTYKVTNDGTTATDVGSGGTPGMPTKTGGQSVKNGSKGGGQQEALDIVDTGSVTI